MNLDNYLTLSQLEDATNLKWSTLRGRLKALGIEAVFIHPRLKLYPRSCVEKLKDYPDHRKKESCKMAEATRKTKWDRGRQLARKEASNG
jgi:hypothetical protein